MTRSRTVSTLPAVVVLMLGGMILSRADETDSKDGQLPVADAECTAFGAGRERTMRRVRRGADVGGESNVVPRHARYSDP